MVWMLGCTSEPVEHLCEADYTVASQYRKTNFIKDHGFVKIRQLFDEVTCLNVCNCNFVNKDVLIIIIIIIIIIINIVGTSCDVKGLDQDTSVSDIESWCSDDVQSRPGL